MKISWLKSANDTKSFKMIKNLGFDVYDIENLDDVDTRIDSLIKDNYSTIILSNEVAGFSSDILKKYQVDKDVNIIIAPSKKRYI